jgi:parvulin-like peptidyl-prolyl isomerase
LIYAAELVSPSKRQRPTAGKGKGESAKAPSRGPAPRQRLALLLFGVVFVALFVGFAIAQGIGYPSVPSGAVAIVKGVPSEVGTITKAQYAKAVVQAAGTSGLKVPPKPGTKKYEELKTTALGSLLDMAWIQGEAEELGVTVTPKQIEDEFESIKSQNFKTPAEYTKFLKTSHLTQKDVDARVKLQLLSQEIQKLLGENPPKASSTEVKDYYEAAKATQFTQKPTRDVLLVVTKEKAAGEKAKALLEKDPTPANWKKVAEKYSIDPTSKAKGGLIEGLSEGAAPEPINGAIFNAPNAKVEGLVKGPNGYYLFEVEKSTPEKVQTLKEVQAQINSQLSQQAQQETFSDFLEGYNSKWKSRTFCASSVTDGIESAQVRDELARRCDNVSPSGHSSSAPSACYEANPKGGIPADCPAPVQQLAPALPGTVNILQPKGKPLPQRPQPEGLKPAVEGEVPSVPGAVPGAATAPPPAE